jgi:hypothetical protein
VTETLDDIDLVPSVGATETANNTTLETTIPILASETEGSSIRKEFTSLTTESRIPISLPSLLFG